LKMLPVVGVEQARRWLEETALLPALPTVVSFVWFHWNAQRLSFGSLLTQSLICHSSTDLAHRQIHRFRFHFLPILSWVTTMMLGPKSPLLTVHLVREPILPVSLAMMSLAIVMLKMTVMRRSLAMTMAMMVALQTGLRSVWECPLLVHRLKS